MTKWNESVEGKLMFSSIDLNEESIILTFNLCDIVTLIKYKYYIASIKTEDYCLLHLSL